MPPKAKMKRNSTKNKIEKSLIKIVIVILTLIIILSISAVLIARSRSIPQNWENKTGEKGYCTADSECVPAGCCHSATCVYKAKAPNCSNSACTAVCEPGTLDCGQAECKCMNSECVTIIG